MPRTLQIRRSSTFSVGTSVVQILGVEAAQEMAIWKTDVELFLIHTTLDGLVVDGGTVPAVDARPIPAGTTLGGIELDPMRIFLGLAASAAGTVTIEFV